VRSFELKLAWAKHQSHLLKDEIRAWRDDGGYRVVFDKDPHRPGHNVHLKVGDIAPGIPLIIGDAFYSLRSGLDHLAHDLAASFTNPLPPEASERSEFPIYGDKLLPEDLAQRKLGAMDPKARAIIEALQPNVRGNAYADDPLWKLNELARIDRHRFIHLTVATLGGIGIGGDNLHIEEIEIGGAGPTAGDGAKLGYASVRPIDPGRPMQMHFTPEPQVVFKEGDWAGAPALDFLAEIRGHIETEVVPLLRPFLKP
jgi:hypothetical protein